MDFHTSMTELGYIPTMKRTEFIRENGVFSTFIQQHLDDNMFVLNTKSDAEYMSQFFHDIMTYCHTHECTHMQIYFVLYLLFYIQKCIIQHALELELTSHNVRLRHEYICLLVSMSRYIQLRERGVPIEDHAQATIVRVMHKNYVSVSKLCEYDFVFWLFRLVFHMFIRECNADEPVMCDVSYLMTIICTMLETESSHTETRFIYHILSSSHFIPGCERLCAKLHSNMHWITLVELMTSIISTIIYYSMERTGIDLDGRWIRFILLLMNDNNNTNMLIDMYPKLLHIIVDILNYRMIDMYFDPYVRQIFSVYNIHAFIRITDIYSPGSRRHQTMCIYLFDLVNYLFDNCPNSVHASHVQQLFQRMTQRFHTPNLNIVFDFVKHAIHYFPDTMSSQYVELCDIYIRRYMEYVEEQDNDSYLGNELTTFLISYASKFITPELFKHLCIHYTCFIPHDAIQFYAIVRMIMQLAFSRQDWRYATILKTYPDMLNEMENPNQTCAKYIKYTLTYTSLKDKCKLHVVENISYYTQIVDIDDFLFVLD